MKSIHAEDKFGGEKTHPVYTLRDQKEEPIVSNLLEESGVSFFIHEYDEGEMDKGYGVIMVVDNDLEIAQEIIEEYIKERPATAVEPLMEFSEEEGSFMPLGMADKEEEENLDHEELEEEAEEEEDDEELEEEDEDDDEELEEEDDEEDEDFDDDEDR